MGLMADRLKQFSNFEKGWNDLKTFARQGLAEIRSVFYAESPHARTTDPAMWGNKLPMEIYQDRHGEPERAIGNADDSLAKLQQQFEPASREPENFQKDDRDIGKE